MLLKKSPAKLKTQKLIDYAKCQMDHSWYLQQPVIIIASADCSAIFRAAPIKELHIIL